MGSCVRAPVESGASTSARSLAKRQSVLFNCQSCPTESKESRIDGTHRTPVIRKSWSRPRSSLAVTGMSPIAVQGRGTASTPDTDSLHGRAAAVYDESDVTIRVGHASHVPLIASRVTRGKERARART
eukprot:6191910-Pleurochrysis_carterae.AAC.1